MKEAIIDRPSWAVNNDLGWAVTTDQQGERQTKKDGSDQGDDRPRPAKSEEEPAAECAQRAA